MACQSLVMILSKFRNFVLYIHVHQIDLTVDISLNIQKIKMTSFPILFNNGITIILTSMLVYKIFIYDWLKWLKLSPIFNEKDVKLKLSVGLQSVVHVYVWGMAGFMSHAYYRVGVFHSRQLFLDNLYPVLSIYEYEDIRSHDDKISLKRYYYWSLQYRLQKMWCNSRNDGYKNC